MDGKYSDHHINKYTELGDGKSTHHHLMDWDWNVLDWNILDWNISDWNVPGCGLLWSPWTKIFGTEKAQTETYLDWNGWTETSWTEKAQTETYQDWNGQTETSGTEKAQTETYQDWNGQTETYWDWNDWTETGFPFQSGLKRLGLNRDEMNENCRAHKICKFCFNKKYHSKAFASADVLL